MSLQEDNEKLRVQLAEAQASLQEMEATICINCMETEADLRAVLKVLTSMPAHRDYDAHFGKALSRPGVRRLLAAKDAT